ncbi:unnamed protein product [Protopolystoma xenopodis]|uniref:Class II aldolase/adducin N-terminal domain-containing protein n=1 Tax=Protopolystoma xenopodis TaxID=117903 RepID=A0A448WJ53_9PLAT|nr:unnamed protein product [Protopolystoma xenopodis]
MEQRDKVHEALGPTARILFVRGRGLFALGESVEETWHYATNAVVACETQLLLASLGSDSLVLPAERIRQRSYDTWRSAGLGGISGPEAALAIRLSSIKKDATLGSRPESPKSVDEIPGRPWRLGELEFEAMMRHLDNAGYRTGHLYRQESMIHANKSTTLPRVGDPAFSGTPRDLGVEIPPVTSSVAATMAHYFSGDETALSGDESDATALKPG